MRRRRRPISAGFVLAEALVALSIAAMTIALLTSATWGLSAAAERRAAAQQTMAVDWLAARRAITAWTAGVTAASNSAVEVSMIGTASTARMVVAQTGSGIVGTYVGELRVEARGTDGFALIAARHIDQADARIASTNPQETEVLQSTAPLRLLYLIPSGPGGRGVWRYETGSGDDGLPLAIGIEAGTQRMITAAIHTTRSASCLARLGFAGVEDERCALR